MLSWCQHYHPYRELSIGWSRLGCSNVQQSCGADRMRCACIFTTYCPPKKIIRKWIQHSMANNLLTKNQQECMYWSIFGTSSLSHKHSGPGAEFPNTRKGGENWQLSQNASRRCMLWLLDEAWMKIWEPLTKCMTVVCWSLHSKQNSVFVKNDATCMFAICNKC